MAVLPLSGNPRQQAIELEYGKPWREVALDLLRRYRRWGKVAEALDVDRATLRRWRRQWEREQQSATNGSHNGAAE